ncbi:hypothetical protein E4U33_001138 [Claviceps sp. LM78 group G4]|nr:hypothetical protein E4U33_001138 [Claviceps sp. LM78 group G4]
MDESTCIELIEMALTVVPLANVVSIMNPQDSQKEAAAQGEQADHRRKHAHRAILQILSSLVTQVLDFCLLSYAKSIVNNYSNLGSIFWAEENCVMVFKGARLAMDNFRAIFVDHPKNSLPLEYAAVTLSRLLGSDNGKKREATENGIQHWRQSICAK